MYYCTCISSGVKYRLKEERKRNKYINNKRTFLETVLFEKLLLDSGIDKTNDVVDVVLDFLSTKKRIISCDFFFSISFFSPTHWPISATSF